MPAKPRRELQGVYGITDERLLDDHTLLAQVEEALKGGISLLQYRSKQAPSDQRRRQARDLVRLCHRHGVPLLINDDVELCRQVGGDGVHLGQQDMDAVTARSRLGPDAIIGVTCHNDLAAARRAEQAGASYAAMGRFFPSRTKPQAPAASLEDLRRARRELTIPLAAIGGITADNGGPLIDAGADLLAVIHYLFAGPDVRHRARKLAALFRQTRAGDS